MMLLSDAKVASMWESKGEAAKRSKGCVGASAADFEGEEADGEAALRFVSCVSDLVRIIGTYIYHSSPQARR